MINAAPVCVRSGQRVEVPLHRVRERGRRLPHPLHLRADAGGQAAVLHGARTRPVQQRRSEEDVILHITTFMLQFRWVALATGQTVIYLQFLQRNWSFPFVDTI